MPADPVVALLPVTQDDRVAAASVLPPHVRAEVIAGDHDTTGVCSAVVQAFARHRTPAPAGDVRIVPVEPTPEMIDAATAFTKRSAPFCSSLWAKMLAASPTPDSSAVSGSAEGLLPIADAPRDGTPIIVPTGPGMFNVVTFWGGGWREPANGLLLRNQPTVFARIPVALTEGQQS